MNINRSNYYYSDGLSVLNSLNLKDVEQLFEYPEINGFAIVDSCLRLLLLLQSSNERNGKIISSFFLEFTIFDRID
jgi:hypothetical protein